VILVAFPVIPDQLFEWNFCMAHQLIAQSIFPALVDYGLDLLKTIWVQPDTGLFSFFILFLIL